MKKTQLIEELHRHLSETQRQLDSHPSGKMGRTIRYLYFNSHQRACELGFNGSQAQWEILVRGRRDDRHTPN